VIAKKIFIIVNPDGDGRGNDAAAIEQILREYDYDVVNPRLFEDYEKPQVRLGLLENFGYFRRDIRNILRCDGIVVLPDFVHNNYETILYTIVKEFPWIGEKGIKYVDEWIEELNSDTGEQA
jgi:hypothetical protein